MQLVLLIFRFSCHLAVEWEYFNATWNYVSRTGIISGMERIIIIGNENIKISIVDVLVYYRYNMLLKC